MLQIQAHLLAGTPTIPRAEYREITARKTFFQSGYGALALLPSASSKQAAKEAGRFCPLQPGALNVVRRRNDVWLQFNHHFSESKGVPTHLGVMVVKVSRFESSLPTLVYRNDNWTRTGQSTLFPSFSRQLPLSWTDFKRYLERWANSGSEVANSDEVLRGIWHATPKGGTVFSWEHRRFWPLQAKNFDFTAHSATGRVLDLSKVNVTAQLIRFMPTPIPQSTSPVVFNLATSDSDAVFIALYSPGFGEGVGEYSNWWWLRFGE